MLDLLSRSFGHCCGSLEELFFSTMAHDTTAAIYKLQLLLQQQTTKSQKSGVSSSDRDHQLGEIIERETSTSAELAPLANSKNVVLLWHSYPMDLDLIVGFLLWACTISANGPCLFAPDNHHNTS